MCQRMINCVTWKLCISNLVMRASHMKVFFYHPYEVFHFLCFYYCSFVIWSLCFSFLLHKGEVKHDAKWCKCTKLFLRIVENFDLYMYVFGQMPCRYRLEFSYLSEVFSTWSLCFQWITESVDELVCSEIGILHQFCNHLASIFFRL